VDSDSERESQFFRRPNRFALRELRYRQTIFTLKCVVAQDPESRRIEKILNFALHSTLREEMMSPELQTPLNQEEPSNSDGIHARFA